MSKTLMSIICIIAGIFIGASGMMLAYNQRWIRNAQPDRSTVMGNFRMGMGQDFDAFAERVLKDDVSEEDYTKAKELYEKAQSLQQDGKLEEAMQAWQELYGMDIFNVDMTNRNPGQFPMGGQKNIQ